MKKNVVITVGTRPEAIKMAPVFLELQKSEVINPVLLATAQHRDMLDQALSVFGIKPDFDLDLMTPGQTLPDLTARMISSVSEFLSNFQADAILVQGDTTTVLGTALAAFYEGVRIGHVEAGLRTNTIQSPFPEEMNRRLTSPLCTWNFAPTQLSKANLLAEGHSESSVTITGNTVIDALFIVRDRLKSRGLTLDGLAERIGVPDSFQIFFKKRWILMTGHRRESFGEGFENLCRSVKLITEKYPDVGVLYPVHLNPRVREPVNRILGGNRQICLIEPVEYEGFVQLMGEATLILSDSGGVQEEAPSLGKAVLVTRETTERPEGVEAGTCTLVGTNPEKILEETSKLLSDPEELKRRSVLKNPYGDGTASRKIRAILERDLLD